MSTLITARPSWASPVHTYSAAWLPYICDKRKITSFTSSTNTALLHPRPHSSTTDWINYVRVDYLIRSVRCIVCGAVMSVVNRWGVKAPLTADLDDLADLKS